jgi:hypothetical protein
MQDARGRFNPLPYDEPSVRSLVVGLQNWIQRHRSRKPGRVAEVATFISPTGSHHRAMETRFNRERIEALRRDSLARSGVPFDDFLIDDFDRVSGRYKAWIFIDTPDLSEAIWNQVESQPKRALFATSGSAVPSPAAIRAFAAEAGCHVWSDGPATLHADSAAVVVACHASSPVTLRFPKPAKLRDAIDGRDLAGSTTTWTFQGKAGEVRIIELV